MNSSFTEDDTYLLHLADVVETRVSQHIQHDLSDLVDSSGNLPGPVTQACLLLLTNLYDNRESLSTANYQKIPLSYEYLLSTFKNYKNSKY